jgi:hypothetical protein
MAPRRAFFLRFQSAVLTAIRAAARAALVGRVVCPCRRFFGPHAHAIFEACWKPVVAMVSAEIQDQLQTYNDVIGLLIMTRIVGHCQLLMIHAQAPVLDGFLDRIGLTLWPHYSRLIRTHIECITPGTLLTALSLILAQLCGLLLAYVHFLGIFHPLSVCAAMDPFE